MTDEMWEPDSTFTKFVLRAVETSGAERYLLGIFECEGGTVTLGPAGARDVIGRISIHEEQMWLVPSDRESDRQRWWDMRWRKPGLPGRAQASRAPELADRLRHVSERELPELLGSRSREELVELAASLRNADVEEQERESSEMTTLALVRLVCIQMHHKIAEAYALLGNVPKKYYHLCWDMTFTKGTLRNAADCQWTPSEPGVVLAFEVSNLPPLEYGYSVWRLPDA